MSNLQTLIDDSKAVKRGEYREKKEFERDTAYQMIDRQAEATFQSPNALYDHFVLQTKLSRLSATNVLLLKAQLPNVSDVGKFDNWKRRGRPVRRGEEGLKILDGKEYINKEGAPATGYDVGHIFDISQTVGEQPPAFDSMSIRANGMMTDYADMLTALVDNAPARIEFVDELPDGVPAIYENGTIFVPDISDVSDVQAISNSLHALGYGCAAAYREQEKLPDDPLVNTCGGILASIYCGAKPSDQALDQVIEQSPSDIRDKKQLLGDARNVGNKLMLQIEQSRDTYHSEHGRAERDQMNAHKHRSQETKQER